MLLSLVLLLHTSSYILVTSTSWSQNGCHQPPGTGASSFISLFPSVFTGPELAEGNSRSIWVLICDQHRCCGSVARLVWLSVTMDCSTPGFPVLHYLPYFAQTHGHWVGDAAQPSHPLLPPSPSCPQSFPASGSFLMSWLFASGGQSIGVSASVLDWRSCLKIRSVQKKIYLRDEERERVGFRVLRILIEEPDQTVPEITSLTFHSWVPVNSLLTLRGFCLFVLLAW